MLLCTLLAISALLLAAPGGFKCTYKDTEDRLGVLLCDGVENVWCEKAPDTREGCGSLFNPVYIAAVLCRW